MKRRKWPFAGDSGVARARKSALAYKELANDLRTEAGVYIDLIRRIDPRIVAWIEDDEFRTVYKQVQEGSIPAPDPVAALDERLYEWGEEWHTEIRRDVYERDELITVNEAARVLGLEPNSVNRLRNRGRVDGVWIKNEGDQNGRWYYKAGDVYALSSEVRGRQSRKNDSTVRVHNSGTGDGE